MKEKELTEFYVAPKVGVHEIVLRHTVMTVSQIDANGINNYTEESGYTLN